MLIMSLGCLQFSREPCLLYTFLLGYLPSIFCDFGEKPIDFYLQDSLIKSCKSQIRYISFYSALSESKISISELVKNFTTSNLNSASFHISKSQAING